MSKFKFAVLVTNTSCGNKIKDAIIEAGASSENVKMIDGETTVPTLEELTVFDAILVNSSSSCWKFPKEIGDVLALYSDQGGGIFILLNFSLLKNSIFRSSHDFIQQLY